MSANSKLKLLKKSYIILIFGILLTFTHCKQGLELGEESSLPVLSTLFNNRMLLLLKGTYSTDSPLEWGELNNGTGDLYIDDQGAGLDPTFNLEGLPKAADLGILLDIGEVRISSKYEKGINDLTQIRNALDSNKFWDFIAPTRQVLCTRTYSFDNNTCIEGNGLLRANDFFTGIGAEYPANDPSAYTVSLTDAISFNQATGGKIMGRQYYYAGIYFRSLVTGYAKNGNAPLIIRFDNRPNIIGSNIVPRNNYFPGTAAVAKTDIVPKMFPALYTQKPTQADMEIRDGFDPYILEVRVNIKENLMVHSYTSAASSTITYVGISDSQYDHKGEGDAGGNLLTRARVMYPETASNITITGGGNSLRHVYGVYRILETEITNVLPLAATPAKTGAKIQYLNPGDYKLICLADATKIDGFPDTVVRETTFSIPEFPFRQTYNVDLSCP